MANKTNIIGALRLVAQQLHASQLTDGANVVQWFGAMQAQDQNMCRWAPAVRTSEHHSTILQAIDNGPIIRTHVLRPTWHLVHSSDVRCFLRLTAPRIRSAYMSWSRKMGIDERALLRYNQQMAKLLEANGPMGRTQLIEALGVGQKALGDFGASILLMNAEMDEVICNAPMYKKETAYCLMDTRVAEAPTMATIDALYRLAMRYFTSHGPASLADFTWWSGLSATDARKAFNAVMHNFEQLEVGSVAYLYSGRHKPHTGNSVHFLPSFDEYLISYKDRTAAIDAQWQAHAITRNGIFKPVLIVDGRVVATWSRTVKKDTTTVTISFFELPAKHLTEQLPQAAAKYAVIDGAPVVVKW